MCDVFLDFFFLLFDMNDLRPLRITLSALHSLDSSPRGIYVIRAMNEILKCLFGIFVLIQ